MSLTQIPSLDSPPPPVKRPSEPVELYSADHWESAYRHMHDFPTLLIQAQDDLARARKREALWISLFVHALLVLLILHPPDFAKYWFRRSVMVVKPEPNRQLTFLEAPPDTQKPVKPPNTDKISDKNRIASTRQPQLDRREMQKILDLARKGHTGEQAAPAVEQPHPGAMEQSPPAQAAPRPSPPPPAPPQVAKLSSPPVQKPLFSSQPMSASRSIQQAASAAAATRGKHSGDMGDLGLNQRQFTTRMGPEILSDTLGVDFGPYLEIVKRVVRRNWYELIPESVEFKKGEVSIQFTILKDGKVAGMGLVSGSGDTALDRAAWGGITASTPFPALPTEFTGPNLTLRFDFFYNLNTDGSEIP
jgi:TonB family protein